MDELLNIFQNNEKKKLIMLINIYETVELFIEIIIDIRCYNVQQRKQLNKCKGSMF